MYLFVAAKGAYPLCLLCVCVCVCVCLPVCVCCECVFVCLCMCVCLCMLVWLFRCVVCVCVCVHMCMHTSETECLCLEATLQEFFSILFNCSDLGVNTGNNSKCSDLNSCNMVIYLEQKLIYICRFWRSMDYLK